MSKSLFSKKKPTKTQQVLTGIFMLLIIFIGIKACSSGSEPTNQNTTPSESMACIQAEEHVTTALVSPATADFPMFDCTARDLGNGLYQVTSYVDSQNGFGAILRSNWAVTIQYVGGNTAATNSWKLEKLIIDGEMLYPQS